MAGPRWPLHAGQCWPRHSPTPTSNKNSWSHRVHLSLGTTPARPPRAAPAPCIPPADGLTPGTAASLHSAETPARPGEGRAAGLGQAGAAGCRECQPAPGQGPSPPQEGRAGVWSFRIYENGNERLNFQPAREKRKKIQKSGKVQKTARKQGKRKDKVVHVFR